MSPPIPATAPRASPRIPGDRIAVAWAAESAGTRGSRRARIEAPSHLACVQGLGCNTRRALTSPWLSCFALVLPTGIWCSKHEPYNLHPAQSIHHHHVPPSCSPPFPGCGWRQAMALRSLAEGPYPIAVQVRENRALAACFKARSLTSLLYFLSPFLSPVLSDLRFLLIVFERSRWL